MPRSERSFHIEGFLNGLERELRIEGMAEDSVPLILEEMRSHLHDAMEEEPDLTESRARLLLQEFGGARKLARSLAAECERAKGRRAYPWPALIVGLVALTFGLVPIGNLVIVGSNYWFGDGILWSVLAALLALGYRARRPLFGQFVGLAAIWIPAVTLFYLFTSVPEVYEGFENPKFQGTVLRSEIASELRFQQHRVDQEDTTIAELRQGAAYYRHPAGPPPSFLVYNGRFVLPDGLRQLNGVTGPGIQKGDTVSNFSEAARRWTVINYVGNRTEAEGLADMLLQDSTEFHAAIDGLRAKAQTSVVTQIAPDLVLVTRQCLPCCFVTCILTNLGWLCWLIVRKVKRALRRYRAMGSFVVR